MYAGKIKKAKRIHKPGMGNVSQCGITKFLTGGSKSAVKSVNAYPARSLPGYRGAVTKAALSSPITKAQTPRSLIAKILGAFR